MSINPVNQVRPALKKQIRPNLGDATKGNSVQLSTPTWRYISSPSPNGSPHLEQRAHVGWKKRFSPACHRERCNRNALTNEPLNEARRREPHLQDFAGDVAAAVAALDAELTLVLLDAVGQAVPTTQREREMRTRTWRTRRSSTYLPMYSPCSRTPLEVHLKHQTCHCLSSAISACPSVISLSQPAQPAAKKVTNSFDFFSWKAKNVPKFRSTDVVLLVFSADDIKVIRVEEEQEQSLPD